MERNKRKIRWKRNTALAALALALLSSAVMPVKASGKKVEITSIAGSAMEHVSGALFQTELTAGMEEVVFRSNDTSFLPDTYFVKVEESGTSYELPSGDTLFGISLQVSGNREVHITGTPESVSIKIVIMPPTPKAVQRPPSVSGGDKEIIGTTPAMEYAPSSTGPWTECSQGTTAVMPGTWLVRNKETPTALPGESAFVQVTGNIQYSVIVNSAQASSHMVWQSGEMQQTTAGAIGDITFDAEDGYYVPVNYVIQMEYAGGSVPIDLVADNEYQGIRFVRNGYEGIVISGTPAENMTLTLTPAVGKTAQPAPAVSGSAGKITGTTTAMECASDPNGPWAVCGGQETMAAEGVWYVRYRETDTQLAGTARKVQVTASAQPLSYTVTVRNGVLGNAAGQGSDSGSYPQGTLVTVTARDTVGEKRFREWAVKKGNVLLQDVRSSTTSFLMPGEDVELEAVYGEAAAGETYDPSTDTGWLLKEAEARQEKERRRLWTPVTAQEKESAGYRNSETPVFSVGTDQAGNRPLLRIVNEMQGELYLKGIKALLETPGSGAEGFEIGCTYNFYPDSATRLKPIYVTPEKRRITLQIPDRLFKEGRSFALICLSEEGAPYVYRDLDGDSGTITIETDRFYAYTLVYQ